MGLLDLCEKYFSSKNLYEVLGISDKANDKEIKKAYHKLSLIVHPDRVKENEKLEATEKFKVLSSIHSILSDKEKRAIYDESGNVDDDDDVVRERDWTAYWRGLFKKITQEDIENYEKEYIGSAQEKEDLRKAYLTGKGDMDYIVDHVQFARSEHEDRLKDIVNEMIKNGEVPAFKIFTHEPEKKRKRRHAKENREAKEAEEYAKELKLGKKEDDLALMIRQKQETREQAFDAFVDGLAAKYGGKKATKRKTPTKSDNGKRKRRN